jgi:glycosyltransferase involved in cell wall biosynthesis
MLAVPTNINNKILSVVIPTWNREVEVIRALDSILPLLKDCSDIELIITDNASSDNTLKVVNSWLHLHNVDAVILDSENNVGPVLNWIKGISTASGHYVSLLFSDDLLQFDGQHKPRQMISSLYRLAQIDVKLIRLPVQIVDNNLHLSTNPLISLPYPCPDSCYVYSCLMAPDDFLLNHLVPRSIPLNRVARSFSPVSPAGYIIERESILTTLNDYRDLHSYKKNGAGIDQLAILFAARDSRQVGFLSSPISIMVASPSSITNNSSKRPKAANKLAISYYMSQLHFSGQSIFDKRNPIFLILFILSLFRLLKQYLLLVTSS